MKLALLFLAIGLYACTGKHATAVLSLSQAQPDRVPFATTPPDYTEAIQEAIARNPPGDYNDPFTLAAVFRSPSPPPEAPVGLFIALIRAIETDIRSLDTELSKQRLTGQELQQKLSEREKLTRELRTFTDLNPQQP